MGRRQPPVVPPGFEELSRVGNPARMPPRVARMVVSRGASEDGGT